MNKIFLRGNVGQDPRITTYDDGGKVAQFTLATTERGYNTKDGRNVPDVTDWHNIVVKRSALAGVVEEFVKKGSPLLIVGKSRTREYNDSEGRTKYITEVIVEEMELLASKGRESAPRPNPNTPRNPENDLPF